MMWSASLIALASLVEAAPPQVPPPSGGNGSTGLGGGTLLRFGCSQIAIESLDPLNNPGMSPSTHLHQIVGGNAFNASMPSTDISKLANCTSCRYSDDFSNYWTANVYFKARNGTYKRVPQVPNRLLFGDNFTTSTQGGVTVYYVSAGPGNVTAFKPGFRMLVGNSMQREKEDEERQYQSCFRCYTGPVVPPSYGGDLLAPCQDPRVDTQAFPPKPCPGGIRSNILFPTCWDGKNLDSPNHKDHVAYPTTGPNLFTGNPNGTCPESHPVKIPQLMLEIVWDTTGFNDLSEWPEDESQPFVLSMGDTTGYGQHGDYVFGWKDDALQRAMDASCYGASCGDLKTQEVVSADKCLVPVTVDEATEGWLTKLPDDGSGA